MRTYSQGYVSRRTDRKKIKEAAILHDVGKIAIPDSILLKPGRLTLLEHDLIKYHLRAGYELLSRIDMYKDLAEIVGAHHERYDGNGYPNGEGRRDSAAF